ncbi:MAG: glycosyltransferase WbuB [Anaerolineae bacterium]|nr:glycosyltransferase WbuB [Gloeobacterales cyanobacterium ES-bin-313]
MRILLYGINYAPELTGVGKYSGEMAEWLATQDHDVRVITAPPYYPAWKVSSEYNGWKHTHEFVNGVEVFRCPLWVKERPSSIERLLHLFSFAISSFLLVLKQITWKPDVVLVIEPALFCVPAALLAANLSGAYTWLHIQDLEVDAAFEMQALPKADFIKRFAFSIERWLMQRFDRVSSISPQMITRCLQKGVCKDQLVFFPNWVDCNSVYPISEPNEFRAGLGIREQETVVLYSGNMGGKQGLDMLLDVADALPSIHFVLCGDGTARQRLQDEAQDMRLRNVHFLPLQPLEQLNVLLNMADIHALVQRDATADLVMPSKLTGMLASGRPIIATARPGTAIADVFQSANCGYLVTPEDPQAFVAALEEMTASPEAAKQYGRNGRQYVYTHLDRNQVLRSLNQELKKLVLGDQPVPAAIRNS